MIARLFQRHRALPVILQAERNECALACVAMVASFHGRQIDLNTLRREHALSGRGATLSELLNVAAALQLETRSLRLDLDELRHLQLPAVLHWDMTHFVVLKKIGRKGLTIHDPAVGQREYPVAEAGRHFTGIAIEVTPGIDFRPQTQILRTRLHELFERHPGFYGAVAQLFMLSFLIQLAGIGSAFYMQLVIDEGLAKQDADFLALLAIAFLMLGLTTVAMSYARSQVQLYFSNQLGFQMVGNVFNHLMSLPVEFFAKRHVGDLVSRFGSIREIRRIIAEDLITVLLDALFALVTLAVMFYFNALLAAVALGFVLVVTAIKLGMIPTIQLLQEQKIIAEARTSSSLMENMRTIEIIKFYCREQARIALWRNHYADQINTNVQLTRFSINMEMVYGVIFSLENVLIIFLAAQLVLEGQISLGFLTAFVSLKGNFSGSIRSFVEKLVQIRLVRLQLERVSDITCTPKEIDTLYLPRLQAPVTGALQLEQVSYCYPGCKISVISQIDLTLAPGEIIAVTGNSGSGKSTLLKLMSGLLQPAYGSIRIDGQDINELGLRQYRNLCAGVLQTDQLLSGTIADNITLFDEDVDRSRLQQAAALACIDQFIQSLPMTYSSQVGDMGSIMSAGQRQRILLARAFYKRPRLLFLDEASANLDEETELEILKSIAGRQITTVMITHRPAPLAIAHRVYHCEQGSLRQVQG